jgi:hypothetical protein
MANDIKLAVSGNLIKNGTIVFSCGMTGYPSGTIVNNSFVKNTPTINTIQSKYDLRFDDPSYYYGIGSGLLIGG